MESPITNSKDLYSLRPYFSYNFGFVVFRKYLFFTTEVETREKDTFLFSYFLSCFPIITFRFSVKVAWLRFPWGNSVNFSCFSLFLIRLSHLALVLRARTLVFSRHIKRKNFSYLYFSKLSARRLIYFSVFAKFNKNFEYFSLFVIVWLGKVCTVKEERSKVEWFKNNYKKNGRDTISQSS